MAAVTGPTASRDGSSDAAGTAPVVIAMAGLRKRFLTRGGEYEALGGIDLTIREGQFTCLLGPSGCGKTTLLRILAGLEPHTDGTLSMRPATGERPLTSVVFQEHSIFPWLSVWDNVAYGLRARHVPRARLREAVDYFVERVGLARFAKAYPHQLSGGMRQRVSIARAFANDPEVLLMDEPFSALDEQNRTVLQEELLRIWAESRKTVVFITHSIDEAVFLADRTVVLGGPPGQIRADLAIPFPRPRDFLALKADPAYGRLVRTISEHIRVSVGQSADADAAASAAAAAAAVPGKASGGTR